jgi:signal transduction histidine kinase
MATGSATLGVLVVAWRAPLAVTARMIGPAQLEASDAAAILESARVLAEADAARVAAEEAGRRVASPDRATEAFLAAVSHEIRTSLNTLIGYAELLELGIDGPLTEAQRDRLARLRLAGEQLLAVVTGALDLARIDAGAATVARRPADLRDVLPLALSRVVPRAAAGRVTLVERCPAGSATRYVGDPDRVEQILVTLLSHAVRSTPPGGRVIVQCARAAVPEPGVTLPSAGPWMRVDVTGAGPVIPAGHRPRVSEPAASGSPATDPETGGTGLDLTIGRRFARLMEGDVLVGNAPGPGARFTLWLPAPP